MRFFKKSKVAIIATLICSMIAGPAMAGNHNNHGNNGRHQQNVRYHDNGHYNNGHYNNGRYNDGYKVNKKAPQPKHDNYPVYHDYRSFGPHDARNLALTYHHSGYKVQPQHYRDQIREGHKFPAGASYRPVPADMHRHLPHRDGYEWRMSGTDLVMVAVGTGIIASVLTGVFR